jgi:hypothetical protein
MNIYIAFITSTTIMTDILSACIVLLWIVDTVCLFKSGVPKVRLAGQMWPRTPLSVAHSPHEKYNIKMCDVLGIAKFLKII